MNICVEGCAHGDLDKIYSRIASYEEETGKKIDLLICCGDFQATRNLEDLRCMAVPQKYLEMGTFYKYYDGTEIAPVLTIFIGGNHEASNHLQELAYGGWVARNIYYLGYANVININGIRIAGISGIYRDYNYRKGHYECPPYDNNTIRTVYSMRNLEVFRMMQLGRSKIDIMISHDWPQKIWEYGDKTKRFGHLSGLLRLKPDFKADMDSGKLGNPPCFELLMKLKPRYWYAAHMHCRFEAKIEHSQDQITEFIALDKCLPGRNCFDFLTIGDEIERNEDGTAKLNLQYDAEWLSILSLTNKFLNCSQSDTNLPYEPSPSKQSSNNQRWNFTPTDDEINSVLKKFGNDLTLRHDFRQTMNSYDPEWDKLDLNKLKMPDAATNIQTTEFCRKLLIDDPLFITAKLNNVKLVIPNYSVSNDDSFNECKNIISEERETTTKKSQLSLPKPINEDEINLEEFDDDVEEELESTKNVDEKEDLKFEEKKLVEGSEIKESDGPLQPAMKKFKRRNQEIYSTTEDE